MRKSLPATRDTSDVSVTIGGVAQRVPLADDPTPQSSGPRASETGLLAVLRPEMFALTAADDPTAPARHRRDDAALRAGTSSIRSCCVRPVRRSSRSRPPTEALASGRPSASDSPPNESRWFAREHPDASRSGRSGRHRDPALVCRVPECRGHRRVVRARPRRLARVRVEPIRPRGAGQYDPHLPRLRVVARHS